MTLTPLALMMVFGHADAVRKFEFLPTQPATSVSVAGSFNSWNKASNPLKWTGAKWSCELSLPPGRYEYKFVVNGTNWLIDPSNPKVNVDADGNKNSVLLVLPEGFNEAAHVGDGIITQSAISHSPNMPSVSVDQGNLVLRLKTRADDVENVAVEINDKRVPMQR